MSAQKQSQLPVMDFTTPLVLVLIPTFFFFSAQVTYLGAAVKGENHASSIQVGAIFESEIAQRIYVCGDFCLSYFLRYRC